MYEFWSQDKLLLMIGVFQFGLILFMFIIFNVSDDNSNLSDTEAATSREPISPDRSNQLSDQFLTIQLEPKAVIMTEQPEVDLTYKVDIAPELLTELLEISNDPAATIDEAIRWWLRRRNLDVLDSSKDRRYRVGINSYSSQRSLQDQWND
jgi:hypothetical protein